MKIAVIGAGNMGGAIAEGAIKKHIVTVDELRVADPRPDFAERLANDSFKIDYTTDNTRAAQDADLVIVAVKPWLVEQVMGEIAPTLNRQSQAVASIAAGITFEQLRQYLANDRLGEIGIYRVIPNTAIALGKSVTFIARCNTSAKHDGQMQTLFNALGDVYDITENQMPACTALASSGIALALRYIDAMTNSGITFGLDKIMSLHIVMKTVEGALALLEHNKSLPQEEINKVTTPGGITLKALKAMEENGFSNAVKTGLAATDESLLKLI
jgi:pyrroline-5-carboxylate reductase